MLLLELIVFKTTLSLGFNAPPLLAQDRKHLRMDLSRFLLLSCLLWYAQNANMMKSGCCNPLWRHCGQLAFSKSNERSSKLSLMAIFCVISVPDSPNTLQKIDVVHTTYKCFYFDTGKYHTYHCKLQGKDNTFDERHPSKLVQEMVKAEHNV